MRLFLSAVFAVAFAFAPGAGLGEAHAETAAAAPECSTDLEAQLEELDVPGLAAAVVKNGRIVCAGAAGMANIGEWRPAAPDTLFLVASVSKTVTATALMQLYDEGRFRLDDDIDGYLPFRVDIPSEPDEPVTFRELLTHTASIADNADYINCPGLCRYGSLMIPFITPGADSPIALADLVSGYFTPGGAYYDEDGNFEGEPPGTEADYSNMGIVLAGYLVEAISGVPLDQYCKQNIFAPLGMSATSFRLADIDPANLAMPYDLTDEETFVPYGQYGQPNYPDGMLRTSANELSRFLIAYMQGGIYEGRRLLEETTVQEMLSSQTPLEEDQGLVWFQKSIGDRTLWGHDGSDNGAAAELWFDPEAGTGVVLMTNGMWSDPDDLLETLFDEADSY
jgi:CubicO group peptidase (beta-lactamase class C family)